MDTGSVTLCSGSRRSFAAVQCARQHTVSRVGWRRIVILLEDLNHLDTRGRWPEKIREQFEHPVPIGRASLMMIPSIGIALYREHADEQQELLESRRPPNVLRKQ